MRAAKFSILGFEASFTLNTMSTVYCLELISHIHKPVSNVKFKQAYIILGSQTYTDNQRNKESWKSSSLRFYTSLISHDNYFRFAGVLTSHEFKTLWLVAVNMNLPPINEPGLDPFIGCTIEQWILWDENIVISASWLLHKPGLKRPSAENTHLLL